MSATRAGALLVAVAALACLPNVSQAQYIVGSSHDFTAYAWSGGEICKPCHTPHNSMAGEDALWNHAMPAGTAFTMYPQSSLTGTIDAVPNGVSLKCLGCHDGVTGIDSYGGATGTWNFAPTDPHNLGADLTNDHPISVDYDMTYHNGTGLNDPSGFYWGVDSPYLFNNKVECLSCHFVHGGPYPSMLRVNNAGSALCLACHNE